MVGKGIEAIAGLGVLCLMMGLGMYLLYRCGWMIVNAKSAVTFIGSQRGKAASFSHCSGYIKRVVRFDEDREYTFTMDAVLSKGSMSVSLLAPDKTELLCLSSAKPQSAIALERKKPYTLILRFQSATGQYRLRWD